MQWHRTGEYREKPGAYTKEELREMLPKVGERRVERAAGSGVIQGIDERPGMCTVEEVHEEHFWYRVRFDKTGACQCFKLPKLGTDTDI